MLDQMLVERFSTVVLNICPQEPAKWHGATPSAEVGTHIGLDQAPPHFSSAPCGPCTISAWPHTVLTQAHIARSGLHASACPM